MATSVTLPALGESVTEGTVTRWLKQPGEEVQVDEPLLEVSTDKVDTEIPSPASGTLLEIKVAEDETVEVGTELAVIGSAADGGGAGGEQAAAPAEQADTPQPSAEHEEKDESAAPAQEAEQAPEPAQAPE
ncbi:MAG: biotin/lipoyl-containing protein, partial [Acidimicrobiales bacterium]